MGIIDPKLALSGIPVPLRESLIVEYNKLLTNFRENRWEPAELNGGKLCEIVYTILKGRIDGQYATKPSKPKNMLVACRDFENAAAEPRSVRLQIPRLLIALYEVRNGRGVGHVGGDVDPNHMDSTLVVGMAQWLMAELVRLFHGISIQEATDTVEGLIERQIPLLWQVGTKTRVLKADMSARDKAFVILYGSRKPLSSRELVDSIEYSNASVFRKKVLSPAHQQAFLDFNVKTDIVTLSPLGMKYVEQNITLTV
jgi:hypothetical protein